MLLRDKISNLNTINKICIFIILFIILVTAIFLVFIKTRNTTQQQASILTNEVIQNTEVATENIITEDKEENVQEEVNQEIIESKNIITKEDNVEVVKQADNNKTEKVEIQVNHSKKEDTNINKNESTENVQKQDKVDNNKIDNNQKENSQVNNSETNNEQNKNEQQNVETNNEQEDTNPSLANTHFTKYNAEKTAHAVAYMNNIIKQDVDYKELGGQAIAVTQKPCKNWFSYSYDEKLKSLSIAGCTIKVYVEDEYRYDSRGINYYLYDTKAYIYQY